VNPAMSVKVDIFYPHLLNIVATEGPLSVTGNTVGACLQDLVRRFPAARGLLFDEQGHLIRNIFVYINEESRYPPELDTPVKEGDTLLIACLVTGG
jgi:molybdopterin converting factor small subunit